MSHASVVSPALALPDLAPLRRPLRAAARVGTVLAPAAAQAIGFAAILYLLVAAPGAVSDPASTVPIHAAASR